MNKNRHNEMINKKISGMGTLVENNVEEQLLEFVRLATLKRLANRRQQTVLPISY